MRNFTRRCHNHDYRAPFIYHVILNKAEGCEDFGKVKGDARIRPGENGSAYIERSRLGRIIERSVRRLQSDFPIIRIYQYSVMPDHLHILLRVMWRSELPLGYYIGQLKQIVRLDYSQLLQTDIESEEIFTAGYCDKPLTRRRSLDSLFRYIAHNPHRLAIRQQYPQFFRRSRSIKIGDKNCEAYGNLFLLRNPDKQAIKISRRFSEYEKSRKRLSWIENASKGAVTISPFISKEEKAIRADLETTGANIILIVHEAFTERFKPSAHDFELCTTGRLLIISLSMPSKTTLTREICIKMNELANEIAEG